LKKKFIERSIIIFIASASINGYLSTTGHHGGSHRRGSPQEQARALPRAEGRRERAPRGGARDGAGAGEGQADENQAGEGAQGGDGQVGEGDGLSAPALRCGRSSRRR